VPALPLLPASALDNPLDAGRSRRANGLLICAYRMRVAHSRQPARFDCPPKSSPDKVPRPGAPQRYLGGVILSAHSSSSGSRAVTIYRGREVTGFAQDDAGVVIELSDGQSLRASLAEQAEWIANQQRSPLAKRTRTTRN
jgi:2-polyprenyl-6-methoxyphenol hydroxylase-like FAD-dependent oxidoreductase